MNIGDLLHLNEGFVFAILYDRPWKDAFADDPGTVGILSVSETCFLLRKDTIWSLIVASKGIKGWVETSKLRTVT